MKKNYDPTDAQNGLATNKLLNMVLEEEKACHEFMAKMRWGANNFVCTKCGRSSNGVKIQKILRFQCPICKYQSSAIVGTYLNRSLIPLKVWFKALWVIVKNDKKLLNYEIMRQTQHDNGPTFGKIVKKLYYLLDRYRLTKKVEFRCEELSIEKDGKIIKTNIAIANEVVTRGVRFIRMEELPQNDLHHQKKFIIKNINIFDDKFTLITNDEGVKKWLKSINKDYIDGKRQPRWSGALGNDKLLNNLKIELDSNNLNNFKDLISSFVYKNNRRTKRHRHLLFYYALKEACKIKC